MTLSPGALAAGLIELGTATATTRNDACTIHQIGNYDLPSECGGALMPPSAWITLRVRPSLLGAAVVAHGEAASGMMPSLYVYSVDGRLAHRVLVHSQDDAERLAAFGRSRVPGVTRPDAAAVVFAESPAEEVPVASSRAGVLAALDTSLPEWSWVDAAGWRGGDLLAQLDAVLGETCLERYAALRDGDRGQDLSRRAKDDRWGVGSVGSSRGVDCAVVSAVFEHLASVGMSVCVGVPSSSVMQLSAGRVHVVERVGSLIVVSLGEGIVELDLAALRSCLVVTSSGPLGSTSTLELYDEGSRCVAVLTQLGLVGADVHRAWEHMLESLPPV
ncbi:hypothetical protein [Pseudoclavibacter helvolus]|uniref:hypothetical protein n=1 Tax=Pseudoclavibacter helvolus TaxID=255205 RepID=UPI003C7357F1